MQTLEFVLTGEQKMHCSGCETRIAYVLRQMPGVHDVCATAANQRVIVLADAAGAIDADHIAEKLKQLGYEAQRVESAA